MLSDQPAKKLHKSEILAICQDCPDRYGPNCIILDIEGTYEEYPEIPDCVTCATKKRPVIDENELSTSEETPSLVRHLRHEKRRTNEEKWRTNEERRTQNGNKEENNPNGAPTNEKSGAPIGERTEINGILLDSLDKEIIGLVAQIAHARLIAKTLKQPETTIRRRLHRMEKHELIISCEGAYRTKLYQVSSKLNHLLLYDDTKPLVTPFTAHRMSFKFPILEGSQPKSNKAYKMNNWTGYVFDDHPDYVIRSTPKNIIVDVRQDLGAASIDDLNLKYSQLAQSHAFKFAEEYQIILGSITKYRSGHFTLEDNPLAQIIAERGEIHTTSGIQIDKSRSSGDLEMKEKTARAMEFTINKLPTMTAGFKSELQEVKQTVETIEKNFDESKANIENVLKWQQMERDNRQLREDNARLEQSLSDITTQVEEIKAQLSHKPDKLHEGGMYG